jgi:branched-chain amino acid transport system permease protein
VLLATSSGLDLSLSVVVLAAFPAVLLGGLESIPGTIVGGLLIGLSQGPLGIADPTRRTIWPEEDREDLGYGSTSTRR